jgi:hypothetical protein
MRARAPLFLSFVSIATTLLLGACGGAIAPDDVTADDSGDARADSRHDGGTDSRTDSHVDSHADSGTDTERDTYIDPGCPDAPLPPTDFKCDPFKTGSCPAGEACYPYVTYPTEPCEHERYGSLCYKAGKGKQGDPCGGGGDFCAAGFVCVVSGSGNQCVQMCKTGSPGVCPDGFVCSPIDVPGIGGCL